MGLVALLLAAPAFEQLDKRIPVVANFSNLGDMVKRIGGELVSITTLVDPNGDTHSPRPQTPVRSVKLSFSL